jgi:hypothetical protein
VRTRQNAARPINFVLGDNLPYGQFLFVFFIRRLLNILTDDRNPDHFLA